MNLDNFTPPADELEILLTTIIHDLRAAGIRCGAGADMERLRRGEPQAMNDALLRDLEQILDTLIELFGNHRRLLESSLGAGEITSAQERIRKKQDEIQAERDRIKRICDLNTHRRKLEKARRDREAKANAED